MYVYKSNRNLDVVRFHFPDGREVNLMGTDAKIALPETARQAATIRKLAAATDEDFEKILSDDRYKSIHKKIIKVDVQRQSFDEDPGNQLSEEE